MTQRKPADASWESWIERQIRDGARDGAFDDLAGQGKPIDDLDRPHDENWWVRAKLQREDVGFTPPTLAIRQERDAAIDEAMRAPDEPAVRRIIDDVNERIRYVNSYVTWGPPTTVAPLDPDEIVERWRVDGQPDRCSPAPAHDVPPSAESARPTRWWHRLRRRRRPPVSVRSAPDSGTD